jgi:hypothetical protein
MSAWRSCQSSWSLIIWAAKSSRCPMSRILLLGAGDPDHRVHGTSAGGRTPTAGPADALPASTTMRVPTRTRV